MNVRLVITRQTFRSGEVIERTRWGAKRGLRKAGDRVVEGASRSVPYELGELSNSATVDADENFAVISYDTVYAARMHENPQFNFQGGREAGWLDRELLAMMDEFPQIMSVSIGRAWK